jgi:hypothetical protein
MGKRTWRQSTASAGSVLQLATGVEKAVGHLLHLTKPRVALFSTMIFTGSFIWLRVMNSPIIMVKPPSPDIGITCRALIVLGHDRRSVMHFNVTQYPNQAWLSRQLTEAFPWDSAPRYLLRDRDTSYGPAFRKSRSSDGH